MYTEIKDGYGVSKDLAHICFTNLLQIRKEKLDRKSEIYRIGLITIEVRLVSGRLPFC